MASLTKEDIRSVIETIKELYLEDMIPWICGYSGGKDSTAVVQLVWYALQELPQEKLKKTVHVISTDTLVESPVVAIWATESLKKMEQAAKERGLPIVPHRLTPAITNTFWVNLIGRGYPYPRRDFRWCTDRMKIDASNRFIKSILDAESEAIMVLGSRKAESAVRKAVLEGYEKKRYRAHLSPNGSFPNSYVFTPIENWLNDNVWQYLVQVPNPWGHSNKDLLAMYSGASADGECPLVIDSSTPSCGNSRFGCWVCTMVTEDMYEAAVSLKTARQRNTCEKENDAIDLLRDFVRCDNCGQPMKRRVSMKHRIRESWNCTNDDCGIRVRISDTQLIETITVLINRVILNDHLLQPKPRKRYEPDAKVTKAGNDIALELERDAPNEEYIIEKTIEMAALMYEQSNAKLNLTVSLARKLAHTMVTQDEFNRDYFTALASCITLGEQGRVVLHTKTETEVALDDGSNESP